MERNSGEEEERGTGNMTAQYISHKDGTGAEGVSLVSVKESASFGIGRLHMSWLRRGERRREVKERERGARMEARRADTQRGREAVSDGRERSA